MISRGNAHPVAKKAFHKQGNPKQSDSWHHRNYLLVVRGNTVIRTKQRAQTKGNARSLAPSWVLITMAHRNILPRQLTGCLQYIKFCWVGKHINIIMKPSNSPTQAKNRLKVAFGATFSPSKIFFSWGWDLFYLRNRLQDT